MASNDVSLDGIILCRDGSFFINDRKFAFLAVRADHKTSKLPLSSLTTISIDEFNWSMHSLPWHVLLALSLHQLPWHADEIHGQAHRNTILAIDNVVYLHK